MGVLPGPSEKRPALSKKKRSAVLRPKMFDDVEKLVGKGTRGEPPPKKAIGLTRASDWGGTCGVNAIREVRTTSRAAEEGGWERRPSAARSIFEEERKQTSRSRQDGNRSQKKR